MVKLNLLQAGQRDELVPRDWKKAVPPWVLLGMLSLSTAAIGWLTGRLDRAEDHKLAQLEAATRNARDVYVAGLSERVATVEADVRQMKDATKQTNDSISRVIGEMKSLAISNERLATKVESMTAELARRP